MYNRELRPSELELTQFTLLMTLDLTGEITQKGLGKLLAMDTTTLTRTLSFLARRGWIREKAGDDRRQKFISLTTDGRRKLLHARPHWERAQEKLRASLGEAAWRQMGQLMGAITAASSAE
jgi:DNA-binding MarR family transcriptional regulator